MSNIIRVVVGSVVVTGVAAAGLWLYKRGMGAGAASLPASNDDPAQTPQPSSPKPDQGPPPGPLKLDPISWEGVLPLPVPADVTGDLTTNWGKTPTDLRPLLVLIEQVSGIVGAARVLGVVASRESDFKASAWNGDADTEFEQRERNASWRGYHNNKDRNPPLMHGDIAANFGSGGLFGGLAPYALWSGVQEMKGKAPLLNSDPRILFLPRVAAFVAAVYLQRLLANYDITDVADIKVGWGSISLLSAAGRKDPDYARIRQGFFEEATKLGIDLNDASTIPPKMNAGAWPGVAKVFAGLVGTLPTPRKVVVT